MSNPDQSFSQDMNLSGRRISSLRVVPLSIPLGSTIRFPTGEATRREYVLIFVRTDDGLEGFAYMYAGTSGARTAALFFEEILKPRVVGELAHGPERLWDALYQDTLLLGRRGIALRALSALNNALWDLLGKSLGVSVQTLLGGIRDRVPAYASGGYYRPGDPLENVRRELRQFREQGFADFKIKVGGASIDVDVARVRVSREVIGKEGRVALDAYHAWRSPADAIRFLRAVEEYEPWWIEEPLPPDDIEGHAEIARATDIPVATGEAHSTRWDFRALITSRAARILQPDVNVVGGISEWMKIAHAAQVFDLQVAPHWHADIHVHLAGAVANCLAVEYFSLDQDIVNIERILVDRLIPQHGWIAVPKRPGLGMQLDMEAVEHYTIRA